MEEKITLRSDNGGYWQEETNLRYFEVCANLRSTGKNANISTLMEMESLGDTYTYSHIKYHELSVFFTRVQTRFQTGTSIMRDHINPKSLRYHRRNTIILTNVDYRANDPSSSCQTE
jgi:hypothetical protein